ncbi:MAG: YiiD C-terminal domain-containing protein [Desulfomonile tiedjei]|uniref:YiiD C-terminal domain-containing protein n=1 Tax=Desulfomonile tiedjei TaxID=2358 RepID=A0A9D6V5M2_9BACT|nr:YiiD C-terminal domain-containing protein [Desulfomonile tiedjei]
MILSPELVKELVEKKVAFVERMRLSAVEMRPCYAKLAAPLKGNENHVGGMYAGALFTLAEMPGGALFLTTFDMTKYYPIVKEMNVQFRRPALSDCTVEVSISESEADRIRDEADKNGKAEFILEAEIKDQSGEVVARSRGIYQIRAIGN